MQKFIPDYGSYEDCFTTHYRKKMRNETYYRLLHIRCHILNMYRLHWVIKQHQWHDPECLKAATVKWRKKQSLLLSTSIEYEISSSSWIERIIVHLKTNSSTSSVFCLFNLISYFIKNLSFSFILFFSLYMCITWCALIHADHNICINRLDI